MTSNNLQTVVITRASETDDGEGGFIEGVRTAVYSGQCRMVTDTLRFSENRAEDAPGVLTQMKRFFVWDQPGPALKVQDEIQVTSLPGQPVYTLMFLWAEYKRTYQVEAWANK